MGVVTVMQTVVPQASLALVVVALAMVLGRQRARGQRQSTERVSSGSQDFEERIAVLLKQAEGVQVLSLPTGVGVGWHCGVVNLSGRVITNLTVDVAMADTTNLDRVVEFAVSAPGPDVHRAVGDAARGGGPVVEVEVAAISRGPDHETEARLSSSLADGRASVMTYDVADRHDGSAVVVSVVARWEDVAGATWSRTDSDRPELLSS